MPLVIKTMEIIGDKKFVHKSGKRPSTWPQRREAEPLKHLLEAENEKYLVAALQRLETNGLMLYNKLVRRIAYRYAKKLGIDLESNCQNGMASQVWLRSFRKRNPTLKMRNASIGIKDETIDKILEETLNDKSIYTQLIKKEEDATCESKTSTVPLLPNVEGAIIKLEQEVQIHPACKEEITIEENNIGTIVLTEETNDNTRKEITEDDVEAYLHSVIDTNFIRMTSGARDWESNSHPIRNRIMSNIHLDNYDMFANYLAPKLRSMKTAKDQLKMIKNIMDLFARNENKTPKKGRPRTKT